jgi:drug/metabolite transporter, DME family
MRNVSVIAPSTTKTQVPIVASLLVAGAGLVWSMGAVTARLAKHTDAWQYLVWRSIGVLIVMEVMTLLKRQKPLMPQAYRTGRMMQLATFGLLLASLSYVYALKNTTAANAAFLSSLTPLVAALFGRVLFKERLSRVTVSCIGMATAGLLVMVLSDLNAGNMVGNAAAMLSSVGFAIYTICIRSSAARNWSPVLPGYALIMIALCGTVTLINGKTLLPPLFDIAMAMIHGGAFIVIGTLLFNIASKSVPAVGMAVLSQVENVFVPVWIFVWFADVPKTTALFGGAIILAAVLTKAVLDARSPWGTRRTNA